MQDLTLWTTPSLDQLSLNKLKAHFDNTSTSGFKLSDYAELSQNMLSYMFSICENKKLHNKVKFQSLSLL